jgi:hypothetical protein
MEEDKSEGMGDNGCTKEEKWPPDPKINEENKQKRE